eukprot:gene6981-2975_t
MVASSPKGLKGPCPLSRILNPASQVEEARPHKGRGDDYRPSGRLSYEPPGTGGDPRPPGTGGRLRIPVRNPSQVEGLTGPISIAERSSKRTSAGSEGGAPPRERQPRGRVTTEGPGHGFGSRDCEETGGRLEDEWRR